MTVICNIFPPRQFLAYSSNFRQKMSIEEKKDSLKNCDVHLTTATKKVEKLSLVTRRPYLRPRQLTTEIPGSVVVISQGGPKDIFQITFKGVSILITNAVTKWHYCIRYMKMSLGQKMEALHIKAIFIGVTVPLFP